MKKNGVFIFVISHIIPEIFTIFVLCKLGTDDVIRCESMEVKTQDKTRFILLSSVLQDIKIKIAKTTKHSTAKE